MDRHLGHGIGGQREHQVNQEVPGRRDDCQAHLVIGLRVRVSSMAPDRLWFGFGLELEAHRDLIREVGAAVRHHAVAG